jgi:prolyl-tRNA editing enzyme YbaK/EbsC (Cys-tRNA(Pro) deacylase)
MCAGAAVSMDASEHSPTHQIGGNDPFGQQKEMKAALGFLAALRRGFLDQ